MPSVYSTALKTLLLSVATAHIATAYPTGRVIYDSTSDGGFLQTSDVSIDSNTIRLKNGDSIKLDKPVLDSRGVRVDGDFVYDGHDGSLFTSEVSIDGNEIKLKNGDSIKLDSPVLNTRDLKVDGDFVYDGPDGSLFTSEVSIDGDEVHLKNGGSIKLDKPVLNTRDVDDDDDEDNVIYDATNNPGSLETSNVSINGNEIQLKNGDSIKLDKSVLDNRSEFDNDNEDNEDNEENDNEDNEDEDEDEVTEEH